MMCSQRPHVLRGGQSQETHKGGRGQVREEAWVTGRVQDRLAPEPPHRSSALAFLVVLGRAHPLSLRASPE